MEDPKQQKLESEVATAVKEFETGDKPATPAAPVIAKIRMRHPLTLDTVDVEPTSEALTPWMVKGYSQFNEPAAPVKK